MNTMTVRTVKKASEAHFANCSTCGILPSNPYWGPARTRGLHESGTGQPVRVIVFQTPRPAHRADGYGGFRKEQVYVLAAGWDQNTAAPTWFLVQEGREVRREYQWDAYAVQLDPIE